MKYSVWRSCERIGIKPPGVVDWDDCDVGTHADILAYGQIRLIEDMECLALSLGSKL